MHVDSRTILRWDFSSGQDMYTGGGVNGQIEGFDCDTGPSPGSGFQVIHEDSFGLVWPQLNRNLYRTRSSFVRSPAITHHIPYGLRPGRC